jgi:hypothetical protein
MSEERDDLDYQHDAVAANDAGDQRDDKEQAAADEPGEPDTETESEADAPSTYGSP